jgi:hypothetical protein
MFRPPRPTCPSRSRTTLHSLGVVCPCRIEQRVIDVILTRVIAAQTAHDPAWVARYRQLTSLFPVDAPRQ